MKLFDPMEEQVEEMEELDDEMEFEDAELLCDIETEPPIQYGEGGRNLDTIYIGHQPLKFGLALRTWVFGRDGLSREMIMPQRQSTRVRAPREKVLTFLSNYYFRNHFFMFLASSLFFSYSYPKLLLLVFTSNLLVSQV